MLAVRTAAISAKRFSAGKAGRDTFADSPLRRLARSTRCRLGTAAGGAFRAICGPRQAVPSCRRGRPFGPAPRHGLHPPIRRPVASAFGRSLHRLRCPPCQMTTGGFRFTLATVRLPCERIGRTTSARDGCGWKAAFDKPRSSWLEREWLRRGGKAPAEAQRVRMASAVRGEVRARQGVPLRTPVPGGRGTQIARNAPPATAASRHQAADAEPRPCGLAR